MREQIKVTMKTEEPTVNIVWTFDVVYGYVTQTVSLVLDVQGMDAWAEVGPGKRWQGIDGCRFLELISEMYKQDLVLSVEYLGG